MLEGDGGVIWLLRHGESEWNATGRWQGHGDPSLSDRGRDALVRAAPRIAAEVSRAGPVKLYCSDLRRAIDTAAVIGGYLAQPAVPMASLRELDVGSWTGLTRDQIAARDPEDLAAFEAADPDVRPGGAESRREIRVRVRGAVEELAVVQPATLSLLLVVHLGVMRALVPGSEPGHLDLQRTTLGAIRRAAGGGLIRRAAEWDSQGGGV